MQQISSSARTKMLANSAMLLVSARQDHHTAGCEKFITEQLWSPSTYDRITFGTDDIPSTISDFPTDNDIKRRNLECAAEQGLQIREVTIEYDADIAFGMRVWGLERPRGVDRVEVLYSFLIPQHLLDRRPLHSR